MAKSVHHSASGVLLEAEVAPNSQARFQKRYHAATSVSVSPGHPGHYQAQTNKWGTELRIYFNDKARASAFKAAGVHVEESRTGYKSGEYTYRVNNNNIWWKLVEHQGFRLGLN